MGVRQELDTRSFGEFEATIHIDTGGPLGSNYFVVVSSNEDVVVSRWFYFDEQVDNYMWNFARKVCTNEEYREKSIDGEADWVRVSEVYEDFEKKLYGVLCDYEKSNFPTIDDESKEDQELLTMYCEGMFEEVKSIIRDDKKDSFELVYMKYSSRLITSLEEKYFD